MNGNDYKNWIVEVKQKIRSSQIKAAIAVNTALIEFYWELGKMLSEKIKQSNWGDKILEQVSKDLRLEFPEMKGFSVSNLKTCKLFYEYFLIGSHVANQNWFQNVLNSSQVVNERQIDKNSLNYQVDNNIVTCFISHFIAQIPWGHNIVVFTKTKDIKTALFYIQKTKENNWSRDMLKTTYC